MIVIIPEGGLCNYLRVMFSYYSLSLEKNTKLIVIWYKTSACPGLFLDYFKPIENITIEYNNNKNYNINYQGCSINKDYPPNYEQLELLPEMKSIIVNKCTILNNNYISVHIRRTDHSDSAKKNNVYTDDIDFINFIDKVIETEKEIETPNLYIATDNKITFSSFKNKYKYKNLIKFDYHTTNEREQRHTTLKDAIIDLYMCVYSSHFMGSGWSSFTDLITTLRTLEIEK